MKLRRLAEAIAIAVVTAVVAMIVRSDHVVLRAIVILAIFVADVSLDITASRKRKRS
ncbi:MAG TPA: hypothetical protein VLE97_08700 [Gaiellaceae bacterium]|nr:hypothetical protein [Gaiellaceae bacterium]